MKQRVKREKQEEKGLKCENNNKNKKQQEKRRVKSADTVMKKYHISEHAPRYDPLDE